MQRNGSFPITATSESSSLDAMTTINVAHPDGHPRPRVCLLLWVACWVLFAGLIVRGVLLRSV
ncbi:MAG TPA: hypothetical protein VFL95_08035, partial [Gemmatimonadales bacterium]|nr:hypothetical protein [Gemmatimonadales bacterium]